MDGERGDRRAHPVLERPLSLDPVQLPDDILSLLQEIDAAEAELSRILADEFVAGRIARQLRRMDSERRPVPGDGLGAAAKGAHAALPVAQMVGRPKSLADITFPADPAGIARVHRRLAGAPGPSRFRNQTASLGGPEEAVACASPAQIPDLASAVLEETHESPHHPVVTTCLLAGRLLWIRPFSSGNRDLSRLLGRLFLHREGYAGAAFIPWRLDTTVWKRADEALAHAVRQDDARVWLRAAVGSYHQLYRMALREARHVAAHVDTLNERQWRVAQWFRTRHADAPAREWRFREIQSAFPYIAPRTLKRDLARLRQEGLLVMDGRLKSARYRYDGVPYSLPGGPSDGGTAAGHARDEDAATAP